MTLVRAAGNFSYSSQFQTAERSLTCAADIIAHGSNSLSSSAGGLNVQSGIHARLESEVQCQARGETTHPNAV